jgi:hypothetical protein
MYEHGTLKPIKVILRRGREKRDHNGGNEPNQGTLHTYIECHNETPCKTNIC